MMVSFPSPPLIVRFTPEDAEQSMMSFPLVPSTVVPTILAAPVQLTPAPAAPSLNNPVTATPATTAARTNILRIAVWTPAILLIIVELEIDIVPLLATVGILSVGISFGVVFGKEIFGGTGYNIFNPALVARAFVFFAYPAQISGSNVWVALDGFTRATPLAVTAATQKGASVIDALSQAGYTFKDMFLGFIPGSIGETSALACVLGLFFLLITGVASWRVVTGCVLGLLAMTSVFYLTRGPEKLAFFALPPHWHLVMGGFAFGAVYMATDPVSSCATETGKWIYGFLIGVLTALIRVINPAYPEGVMLAILFMNAFAPLIDHFVMEAHIKKRNKEFARG